MVLYHVTTKNNLKSILKSGNIRFGRSPFTRKAGVFLTNKKGIKVVAKGWVCFTNRLKNGNGVVVLKVNVPVGWLEEPIGKKGKYEYNPVALEWASLQEIPISRIIDVYDFEEC